MSLFSGKSPPWLFSTGSQKVLRNPEAQTCTFREPCAAEREVIVHKTSDHVARRGRRVQRQEAEEGSAALTEVTASATRVGFRQAISRGLSRSHWAGEIWRSQVFHLEAFACRRCISCHDSRPTSPQITATGLPSGPSHSAQEA